MSIKNDDGYECNCDENFKLADNGTCITSLHCPKNPCKDENAECEEDPDHSDGYRCPCKDGFRGNGKKVCYDINECLDKSHNCDRQKGICLNKKGTFDCSCDFGYTGDGYSCEDIDECQNKESTCPTDSTCLNTDGSYFCKCTRQACGEFGTCHNDNKGKAYCKCDVFYKYYDGTCVADNKCSQDPCGAAGDCQTVLMGGAVTYTCNCDTGYAFSTGTCLDKDECADNPCDAGQTCVNSPGSYNCTGG